MKGLEVTPVQPSANPLRLLVVTLPDERADLSALCRGQAERERALTTQHIQRYRLGAPGNPRERLHAKKESVYTREHVVRRDAAEASGTGVQHVVDGGTACIVEHQPKVKH